MHYENSLTLYNNSRFFFIIIIVVGIFPFNCPCYGTRTQTATFLHYIINLIGQKKNVSESNLSRLTRKPTKSLCAQRRLFSLSAWRKFGSLATHWVHSEDSDQTGRMPRLIWVFAGRTAILLVLSWGGSFSPRVTVYQPSNLYNDDWLIMIMDDRVCCCWENIRKFTKFTIL